MRVVFLGTGGYHPSARRHTACVMLPEMGVVFDAGTGFFRVAERVETDELHLFVTHAHLDHICGLPYFLRALFNKRPRRAIVHSASKYLDAIQRHLLADPLFPVMPGYEFAPLDTSVGLPREGLLTHCPLNHPGGSIGYKFAWSGGKERAKSLAYITDTSVDGTYTDFVRGVDLLIHECNFSDEHAEWASRTGHSHTTAVAQLARDAGVKRLVLVHIDPEQTGDDPINLAAAQAIFPATQVAEDLQVLDI
jgi:ribonuclease Z